MPMLKKGTGVVLVVCSKCGLILEHYAMGDRENRKKYSGIPTPSKAIAPYGGRCYCKRELSRVPLRIQVMSTSKFNEIYEVTEAKINGKPLRGVYKIKRRDVSVVEDQIRASTEVGAISPIGLEEAIQGADDEF